MKDHCWYPYDTDILAVIPEPTGAATSRHREVDPEIWRIVMEHLEKVQ